MFIRYLAASAAIALASAVPAAAQEVTELRFAVQTPEQVHYNKQLFAPWAEKVAADSGGTLKVTMYYAGTLGKEGQFIDLVESGAADIALDIPAYYPGRFKLTDVASVPLLISDATSGSKALWSMYEEGAFGGEFDGLKVLALSTPPAAMLMTTDTPVTTPADMDGLKIAGGGKLKGDMISATGAAPVEVKIFELYQGLDRGVVDGAITYYTAIPPFKLNEVGEHYTDVPLGGSLMLVFMSQDRFDSLPEAARKAIDMNSGAAMSEAFGGVWDGAQKVGRGMAEKSGGTFHAVDDEAMAEWGALMAPIVDAWAAEAEGRDAVISALKSKLGE